METYRIDAPPFSPGIYALKNRETGHIYIGQSRNLNRRYQEWRGLIRAGMGKANMIFMEIARQSKAADWDFIVVSHVKAGDAKKLDELEKRAIERIAAGAGDFCLNKAGVLLPPPVHRLPQRANVRKSIILGEQGQVLSYGEAAAALGVKTQAVKKRMQSLRARGVNETTLMALST